MPPKAQLWPAMSNAYFTLWLTRGRLGPAMAKTSVFPHKADLQKGGKWWLGIVDQHYLVGMA